MDNQYQDLSNFDISQNKIKKIKDSLKLDFKSAKSIRIDLNQSPMISPLRTEGPLAKTSFFQ